MSAVDITTTKAAILFAVNQLPLGHCKLSMTKFGTTHESWEGSGNLYTDEMKASAIEWINQLEANMRRKELCSCLRLVLEQPFDNDYKRQILLITDAAVQDNGELATLVMKHYEDPPDYEGNVPYCPDPENRFFVLGLGSGVSKSLCEDIATKGGGIAAFAQAKFLHDTSGKGLATEFEIFFETSLELILVTLHRHFC